jgi:hypothetical protein
MADDYLRQRVEFVRSAQNADGGWGYLPGRQSWTEPTAYAMLALHGEPEEAETLDRAWRLLGSWQLPDGAWKPAAHIEQASWTTALAVTLHNARGVYDDGFRRGVQWLVGTRGAEGGWLRRVLYRVRPNLIDSDPRLLGWPWLPGTGSWVEPTCHALVALRRAAGPLVEAGYRDGRQITGRVRMAERMLQQRRARDGGWNYGNRIVLGEELPSYPESTGIALLGMKGCPDFDATEAIEVALRQYRETRSPLARAWLTIGLRNHGVPLPDGARESSEPSPYVHVAALEAIGAHSSNYRLLAAEEAG